MSSKDILISLMSAMASVGDISFSNLTEYLELKDEEKEKIETMFGRLRKFKSRF